MSSYAQELGNYRTRDRTEVSQGIESLIRALANDSGLERRRARLALVDLGAAALPALTEALSHPNRDVRWEAAKALGEIGDPVAASALVKTLEDDRFGVRWLAAESLVGLGPAALPPLMEALSLRSDSHPLRSGAHHVLRAMARGQGLPASVCHVLAALEDVEPAVEVPALACTAWRELAPSPYLYSDD